MLTINYALTTRHDFPEGVSAIFGDTISPEKLVNPELLEREAYTRLMLKLNADRLCIWSGWDWNESEDDWIEDDVEVRLYTSGLTVALLAVINAIKRLCPEWAITVMHYNRETGKYYGQKII